MGTVIAFPTLSDRLKREKLKKEIVKIEKKLMLTEVVAFIALFGMLYLGYKSTKGER